MPLLLALQLLTSALLGQESTAATGAPEPPALFTESVRVDLVNVDVRVSDHQGNPVRDLTAEDFEVFEDGRPVAITHFAVIEDRLRTDPREALIAEARRAAAPSEPAPSVQARELDEDERLRLVLFFDNDNVRPLERDRVLRSLESFVRRTVGPDDLAMVVSYGRAIKIHQHFTSDTNLIAEALVGLEKSAGHKVLRDRERQDALRTVDETSSADIALTAVRNHAEVVYNEMGYAVEGLKETIDFLAGLPGRKALVHVSGGMPMIAAEDLFYAVHEKFGDSHALGQAARYDLSRGFREVQQRANANGVTLYTLDVGGLRTNTSGSAEYQGMQTAGLLFRLDSDYQSNLQAPLHYLAKETGGQAIVNQNEILPALDRVATDLRTFYSLGYLPSAAGDGRYHAIKVDVKRKNVQVRHRSGYHDKSAETLMVEGTLAALVHSYEQNLFGLELTVEGQEKNGDSTYRVGLLIRVPMAGIAILPMGERSHTRLRFFLAVMDEQGRASDVQQIPIGLQFRPEHVEAARSEAYLHRRQLLMRGGRHKVAVGLRDELSGQSAFVTRTVIVSD